MADELTPAEFAQLRRLPPAQAMAWMQQRSHGVLSFSWQDLWQQEHGHHFTISRLARLDLLQSIHESLSRSVAGDLSRRDWTRDTRQLLAQAGWWGEKQVLDPATGKLVTTRFDPARLKLIHDTNTRQAAAAGQWERIQRGKRALPYLRYITKRDDRVRPLHASWDNVTLPVDDGFWHTHFPPNGWNCRCRVVGVSQADYDRSRTPGGGTMNKDRPQVFEQTFVNRRSGEESQVPVGIDPGFGFNPGEARLQSLQALIREKLASAIPALAKAAEYEGLSLEVAAATYAEEVRLAGREKLPALPLAPISSSAAEQAEALGVKLGPRVLALDFDGIRHTLTEHSAQREALRGQVPLASADFATFPQIFNTARLRIGSPAVARDGTRVLEGVSELGDYRYELVVHVRRRMVVLHTMYKRRLK